jgi:mono/diheme cytochrome c family protein
VDAADPRRRDAAEEGVMSFPFGVIASKAKRSPAANRMAEIASSRFALLVMTAFFLAASPPARAADGDVDQGRDTYLDLCASCHGRDMVNPGTLSFDLRKFPKDDFARFKASVLNGKGTAMPAWAGKVSDEDVANLWAYVRSGG